MTPLAERVRQRSLERWYHASRSPARRHPVWQSPLAVDLDAADGTERAARLRIAGGLWLRNFDLRTAGQLWLADHASETSWAFRRARLEGEQHLVIGPVAGLLLEGGRRLFGSALRYRESDDPALDALLRSLAPPLPAG